jgi:hypothetical protein
MHFQREENEKLMMNEELLKMSGNTGLSLREKRS